ncbi:MAG: type II secretion system F family protein [Firmicutes bacterium]|nr:type II secretion system F family protein [Bacillota bacterium]
MKKRSFIDKIYPKKIIKKYNVKIELLSDDTTLNVRKFLYYRLIGSLLIFILFGVFSKYSYITAPLFTLIYYIGITYLLIDYPTKKRGLELEHEAIFFFEILELTLESGRTLSQALEITANNVDSKLSKEFKKTLSEVKMGKSLIESLKAMKERIPSDTINNTILNMTESSIFGSNIINSINNQLDYLRNKELMEIKARIAKLPTKISIVSVLLFIPLILLIILSPVLIELITG